MCNAASNPYYGSQLEISDEAFTKILANNIIANNWLISFTVPHYPTYDQILASEIQGVRAFGSDNQMETVEAKLAGPQFTIEIGVIAAK